MSVEAFIGWRYMKAKRKQTFISFISTISLVGVALGVMALIVVMAVMSGTEEEIKDRILGVTSHILLYGSSVDDYRKLMGVVENVEGVVSASPFIYSQVMISGPGGASGAVLYGIDPEYSAKNEKLTRNVVKGDVDALNNDASKDGSIPKVLLGIELAKQAGVEELGDAVRVITTIRTEDAENIQPRSRVFQVGGLIDIGMYEHNTTLLYMSLKDAQSFLDMKGVTGLEIWVDDIYRADAIREAVFEATGRAYWVVDWMQMNRNLFRALNHQKLALAIILSLTIIVAAFNIISTLIMVVMDKRRDIAILKAMGASTSVIMKIFVFQGVFIGVVGTLFGLFGGTVVCEILKRYQIIELSADVYFITTLPARMEPVEVGLVTLGAVLICFLATIYPSWQASRLNPVEALRYE